MTLIRLLHAEGTIETWWSLQQICTFQLSLIAVLHLTQSALAGLLARYLFKHLLLNLLQQCDNAGCEIKQMVTLCRNRSNADIEVMLTDIVHHMMLRPFAMSSQLSPQSMGCCRTLSMTNISVKFVSKHTAVKSSYMHTQSVAMLSLSGAGLCMQITYNDWC